MLSDFDDLTDVSLHQLMEIHDWQAKYRLIISWGNLIHQKPDIRQPLNLIKGCEVSVWVAHTVDDSDRHRFRFDSDSRVIRGLGAFIFSIADNKTTDELRQINFAELLIKSGLEKHLTPTRNNGFRAILQRINECANVTINP